MINFPVTLETWKVLRVSFPLVTQPEIICQTGGSVQARIAEERESSHAQIRTMLDEQTKNDYRWMQWKSSSSRTPRSTCRTRSKNSAKKNFCDNNRIFVKFINKILWNIKNCKNSRILPLMSSTRRKFIEDPEDYYGIILKTSSITEWSKFHEWFQGFYGCWVDLQWKSTRYQSTWVIP